MPIFLDNAMHAPYTAHVAMSVPYTIVNKEAPEPIYDLTIITVCRNVLPQLKKTVASVIGQKAVYSSVSIEHLIVDGASTDGTPAWLAEMQAQGKIDAYISEPDRGIYDAMNKGINLARGRVLLFLNADDTLTQVDLAPCVLPIVRGECVATAASTAWHDNRDFFQLRVPDTRRLYISCPICHQAFFASASLYRALGGYDSQTFLSSADTDFMHRVIRENGFPRVVEATVSDMPAGGFSTNCSYKYCYELIEIMYRNRECMLALCNKDAAFCSALAAAVLNHCITLRRWQHENSRNIKHQLGLLQEICRSLARTTTQRRIRRAMVYAAEHYLPVLLKHPCCSRTEWFRLLLCRISVRVPQQNPYYESVRSNNMSYWQLFRSCVINLFSKKG